MRRLVVNADDLGLTTGVNDGIFDAHEHGILTSASLFAAAPATQDAIRRMRFHPRLGVGVHLALVDGAPILAPARIPSLLDGDGRFRRSWKPFIVACLRGRISLADVERELTAQVERVLDAGVQPTHLDAHKHVHMYPPIFAIVARLAARFGIPVVRVPFEAKALASIAAAPAAARQTARRQALLNAAMWPWVRTNTRLAAELGIRTPRFTGRIHTGLLDQPSLHALVGAIEPGVTELMVHPGYVDAALTRMNTRLIESRARELNLLCGLDVRALVAAEGIDLVRHDLTPVVRRSFRHAS